MAFHHVGIATDDLDALAACYGQLLDLEVVHEETLDDLHVAFMDLGDGYLELLEPLGSAGPIADHLERGGTAIHHVAIAVPEVAAALERAEAAGIRAIDETPRPGAWGHEVAFLHPGDTGGVLLEFVQA